MGDLSEKEKVWLLKGLSKQGKKAAMDRFAFVTAAFEGIFAKERPSKGTIAYQAVFMMGLPGAGKSYYKVRKYLAHAGFQDIDPDEIKKTHPNYDPDKPFLVHEWSKEVASSQLKAALLKGDPFVYDGTGTTLSEMTGRIRQAREAGYRIFLTYVSVPLVLSFYRNRNRDRFVPEKIIIEKAAKMDEAFGVVKRLVDKVKIVAGYEAAELRAAEKDLEFYPPPQKIRPPRPGDSDYGMSKTAAVLRLYEYIADDGTIYWSQTQNPTLVSPPTRLLLQDRRGLVLGQFLMRFRTDGAVEEEEEG